MAGTIEISTLNLTSPNGLVTKPITLDNSGNALFNGEQIASTSSPVFTGDVVLPSTTTIGNVSSTEIGYLNGVTGLIQEQFNIINTKNWIINGQFDIWQRGTSFTSAGYNADRWVYTASSGFTLTRQTFSVGQIDVPNNPKYYLNLNITSNNQNAEIIQRIEDVTKFSGKTLTLSFWSRLNSGSLSVATDMFLNFGSGGSSLIGTTGGGSFTPTSTWQRFTRTFAVPSISGKTIGDNNFLWFRLFQVGNTGTGSIDIANVCLVEGSQAQECPSEPYAEVLRKCQRYYYRVDSIDVYTRFLFGHAVSIAELWFYILISVQMRTKPSSVEYSTLLGFDGVNSVPISAITISDSGNQSLLVKATTTGASQYRTYALIANNSASAFFALNAEL